VVAKMLGQ